MLLPLGWFGDPVQEGDTQEHEPQDNLQAVWLVEPGAPKFQDVLQILEALLNLEAVIVDADNLGTAARLVIGQDIPRLVVLAIFRGTDNPEG